MMIQHHSIHMLIMAIYTFAVYISTLADRGGQWILTSSTDFFFHYKS